MFLRTTLVATACMLALAACNRSQTDDTTTPGGEMPAASATTTMPAPASTTAMPAASSTTALPSASSTMPPAASTTAAAAATTTPAAAGDKPAAVVKDCATQVEGNDSMQYNVGSITIPASCSKFTINLAHTGTMPVAAMGHNVVIAKTADMQGVLADGVGAGLGSDYVKAGDARVIAHTKLVGGGQSTSISFDTGKIKQGGPYEFFCSFPGHATVMKGTISVG